VKPSALVDTRVVYCGDNIDQLANLPDGCCVDLIYIDPPFNSNRNYEVFWGETKETRAFEDRHVITEAYIGYMRPRCEELHRVLKPTGSFYYHCDWHASHYIKVMLAQILGEDQFVNEVVWKRQTSHNDAKQGGKHYGRLHDLLLFYRGGRADYTWNQQYVLLDQSYIDSHYSQADEQGRRFQWGDLRAPGGASPSKGTRTTPCLASKATGGTAREDGAIHPRGARRHSNERRQGAALQAIPGRIERAPGRQPLGRHQPDQLTGARITRLPDTEAVAVAGAHHHDQQQ
jgi:hypothetical protein